jgi:hypothetical protein
MDDAFPELVTKKELMQVCFETQDMINGLRIAHNAQAEVASLHRFLLERFIPKEVLTQAVDEYAKLRAEMIEQERLNSVGIAASTNGN